jgi:hypothetical protein
MNSVLSSELETKRLTIARKHNSLVIRLMVFVFGSLIIALLILNSQKVSARPLPLGIILTVFVLAGGFEFVGLMRIFKYDQQMCRELGFVCPHCGKPLYEPRSWINVNGLCPKCKKSIL